MINNVQALRAFAAVMVIFAHMDQVLARLGVPTFGWSAVQLFFVISGFVMVYTTRSRPTSPAGFARKRIARIVPIYWVLTLAVFAVAIVAPNLLGATRADPVFLLKSLLFIPFEKQPGLVQPILFLGWTLNYEMFFYALFALSLAMRRQVVGIALVMAGLVGLVILGAIMGPKGVLATFYTHPIILNFVFGMAVALAVERAPRTAGTAWKIAGVVCLLIAAPLLFIADIAWPQFPNVISLGLSATVLVASAVLIERWGWGMTSKLVLAIGEASYVLYLSHVYIARPFQKLILHFALPAPAIVAAIGLCLVVIVAVAMVLHVTLERPLSQLALRWIPKPQRG